MAAIRNRGAGGSLVNLARLCILPLHQRECRRQPSSLDAQRWAGGDRQDQHRTNATPTKRRPTLAQVDSAKPVCSTTHRAHSETGRAGAKHIAREMLQSGGAVSRGHPGQRARRGTGGATRGMAGGRSTHLVTLRHNGAVGGSELQPFSLLLDSILQIDKITPLSRPRLSTRCRRPRASRWCASPPRRPHPTPRRRTVLAATL
eukprot:COSAG04_NODE_1971_length_5106_cov_1.690034_3_plen_203_part_00